MTGRVSDSQDRTMPIPGRVSLSEIGTTPIEPAKQEIPRPSAESLASTDPRGEVVSPSAKPEPAPAGLPKYAWVGVVLLAVGLVFGIRAWTQTEAGTGTETESGSETETETETQTGTETETQTETETETETETQTQTGTETQTQTGTETQTQTGTETETETQVPPAAAATLTINARPWGNYYLDGRQLSGRRISNARITAGAHTLRIENPPLGGDVSQRFEVPAGGSVTATVDFSSPEPQIVISR